MGAALSHGSSSEKRPTPAKVVRWMFKFARMFWVTILALLVVLAIGLLAGWSERRVWSDAFFYAATAQMFVVGIYVYGTSGEVSAASEVRYVPKGSVSETQREVLEAAQRKAPFALRVFAGTVITYLISALIMRL